MNFKTILFTLFIFTITLFSTETFAQQTNTSGMSGREVRKQDREVNLLARAEKKQNKESQQTATAAEDKFNDTAKISRRDNIDSNGAARQTEKSERSERKSQRKQGRNRN
jgi:hypothetical protein